MGQHRVGDGPLARQEQEHGDKRVSSLLLNSPSCLLIPQDCVEDWEVGSAQQPPEAPYLMPCPGNGTPQLRVTVSAGDATEPQLGPPQPMPGNSGPSRIC